MCCYVVNIRNWSRLFFTFVQSATVCLILMTHAGMAEEARPAPISSNLPAPTARVYLDLDPGWRFSRGDITGAMMPEFDDTGWRQLNVPHDWSSEGPFSAELGSGNGFAPAGIGWYRNHFQLDPALRDKLAAVEFDGVYDHAEVWINGHFVGGRPSLCWARLGFHTLARTQLHDR